MLKNAISFIILLFQISLLSYICYVIYINSLSNDWAFDDYLAIYNNKDVAEGANYINLWRNDIWGKSLLAHDSHRSFRPLLVVVFKWLRSLYGLTPSAFRIASICSHLIATIILYYVGNIVIGSSYISFGACLLFLTHPVHVESVSAVVNMAEPMCAIFILISYIMYRKSTYKFDHKDVSNSNKSGSGMIITAIKTVFHVIYYSVISFICISIASLLKETGITIAGIVVGSGCVAITVEFIHQYIYPSVSNSNIYNTNGNNGIVNTNTKPYQFVGSGGRVYLQLYWISFSFFCVFMYLVMRIIVVAYDPVNFIQSVPLIHTLYSACAAGGTVILIFLSAFIQVLDRFGVLNIFKTSLGLNIKYILLIIKNIALNLEANTVGHTINNNTHSSEITLQDILITILSYTYPPLLKYIPFVHVSNTNTDMEVKSFYLGNSGLLRKAENPFATLIGYEKLYSLCYLHFRYLYQLIYPIRLVAEYSYDCIPKVESIADERMVYVISMYTGLLVLILIGIYWLFYVENDRKYYDSLYPVDEMVTFELDISESDESPSSTNSPVVDNCVDSSSTSTNIDDVGMVHNELKSSMKKPVGLEDCDVSIGSSDCPFSPDKEERKVSFDLQEQKTSKSKAKSKDNENTVGKAVTASLVEEDVALLGLKDEESTTSSTVTTATIACNTNTATSANVASKPTDTGTTVATTATWYIHNDALLHSIMWLIIPFIPASGVFLKLGTLLAERLLYLPSIGYCWLLSIGIYIACRFVFVPLEYMYNSIMAIAMVTPQEPTTATSPTTTTHSPSSRNWKLKSKAITTTKYWFSENMAKLLYCITICCISYWYGMLTIARNPIWKDDHTLHVDTLKGCPNSAKSHLQNARIHLGNGDMTQTVYHINRAKEIDPDFCDTGYQEALVSIMTNTDPMVAMVLAANNLHCVFTNMQSMELINKVFQNQLQQMPNDFRIYENWGDILSIPALYGSAAQKYLNAITDAIDKKQYEKAIYISLKAEKSINYFYNQSITATMDDLTAAETNRHVLDDLSCQIYSVSGRIRLQLLEMLKNGQYKLPMKRITFPRGVGHLVIPSYNMEYQLSRSKTLLFKSLQPKCVIVDPMNSKIVSNTAVSVMENILQIVTDDFGSIYNNDVEVFTNRNAQATLNYALFAETIFHTMSRMRIYADKPKRIKKSKQSKQYQQAMLAYEQQQEGLHKQATVYLDQSIQLYKHAADLFYFEYNESEYALYWYNHLYTINNTKPMDIPMSSVEGNACHFGINELNTVNKSCFSNLSVNIDMKLDSNSNTADGKKFDANSITMSRMVDILKVIHMGYESRLHEANMKLNMNMESMTSNTINNSKSKSKSKNKKEKRKKTEEKDKRKKKKKSKN